MSITKERTVELVKKFGETPKDAGKPEVQVAILSERIKNLTEHFKTHKQDDHGRRGLRGLVNRRRKLLDYLKDRNVDRYKAIVAALGLRR